MVKVNGQISTREFEDILWIKVDGRGSFQTSPPIKELIESEMGDGREQFVIDLKSCTGMDSTFMGMMAGVGMRLRKKGAGELSVVGTSEKSRDSLEELGLSYLMEIEPEEGPWIGRLDEVRDGLAPFDPSGTQPDEKHILESHENLCDADETNLDRFKNVLDVMGSKRTAPEGEDGD